MQLPRSQASLASAGHGVCADAREPGLGRAVEAKALSLSYGRPLLAQLVLRSEVSFHSGPPVPSKFECPCGSLVKGRG